MLEGGCHVPIGVNASVLENGDVVIKSTLGLPSGNEVLGETKVGKKEDFRVLGKQMAQRLIDKGAKELLERADKEASET